MVHLWVSVPDVVGHINVRLNDHRQELLDIIFTSPNSSFYSLPLNTGFCLGNAKEFLQDCTFTLNNEGKMEISWWNLHQKYIESNGKEIGWHLNVETPFEFQLGVC